MYEDFALSMLKVVGIMLGAFGLMLMLAIAFLQMWIRRSARNKIYALFLDHKQLFSAMLPIEGDCIYYGKGENKEKYLLDTEKQFWVTWPPVGSSLVGTSVRAHWYVRNRPTPLDPSGKGASLTSRSLRMIGDEAMLKTTWKDIRDTAGVPSGGAKPGLVTTLVLAGLVTLGGLNLYLVMDVQQVVGSIAKLVGVEVE